MAASAVRECEALKAAGTSTTMWRLWLLSIPQHGRTWPPMYLCFFFFFLPIAADVVLAQQSA